MTRASLALALLLLAACAPRQDGAHEQASAPAEPAAPAADTPEPAPDATGYRAGGNEPFWSLTIDAGEMRFDHMGDDSASAPRPEPVSTGATIRYAANADGQPFIVEIAMDYCADSMSGRPFPETVTVNVHGQSFEGCGGDSARLLTGGEWRVTQIGDAPVPADAGIAIGFGEDGRISGNAGCNRFMGPYEIGGEGISTGPMASTRRACIDPAASARETRLLAILGGLRTFSIDDDGRLVLQGNAESEIIAER